MSAGRRAGAPAAALLAAAIAGQIAPRALGDPDVRRHFPRLAGTGRPDHVALTFDDGPDPASTPQILERLASSDTRATFFCLGAMIPAAGGLPAQMAGAGHELAVHGLDHGAQITRTPGQWREQLHRARTLIEDAAGAPCTWYRPPYGKLNGAVVWAARSLGLRPVLWGAAGEDWIAGCSAASVLGALEGDLHGGVTVLLHDTDAQAAPGSWRGTRDALSPLIDGLATRGLAVGPLRDHGLR